MSIPWTALRKQAAHDSTAQLFSIHHCTVDYGGRNPCTGINKGGKNSEEKRIQPVLRGNKVKVSSCCLTGFSLQTLSKSFHTHWGHSRGTGLRSLPLCRLFLVCPARKGMLSPWTLNLLWLPCVSSGRTLSTCKWAGAVTQAH